MLHSLSRRLVLAISSLVVVVVGVGALVPQPVMAADCGGVETSIISGTICDGADKESKDSSKNPIVSVLTFVLQILTGAVGLAAVGAIIYGAILYSSAGGNSGQVEKAKTTIMNTVIGIVCYAGMILILNFIIPGGVFGQEGVNGSGTSASPGGGSGPTPKATNDTKTTLSLNIASWNVFLRNKTSNVMSGTKSLLEDVDILGIQEAGGYATTIKKQFACSSCDYQMYPDTNISPKKVAIIWRRDKFTLVGKGYVHGGTQAGSKKYIVWVKLQEKKSGKVFYALNTHFPFDSTDNGNVKNTEGGRAYKVHMPRTAELIKELQKDKLPIFMTGDINSDYRTDSCKSAYLPCKALKRDLDVKSGWDYLGTESLGSSTGTASSQRIIDYVFSWDLDYVTYSSMKIIRGGDSRDGWSGSDHKPVALKLTIKAQE